MGFSARITRLPGQGRENIKEKKTHCCDTKSKENICGFYSSIEIHAKIPLRSQQAEGNLVQDNMTTQGRSYRSGCCYAERREESHDGAYSEDGAPELEPVCRRSLQMDPGNKRSKTE